MKAMTKGRVALFAERIAVSLTKSIVSCTKLFKKLNTSSPMLRLPSRETDPEQFPSGPIEYEGTGEVERAILDNLWPIPGLDQEGKLIDETHE